MSLRRAARARASEGAPDMRMTRAESGRTRAPRLHRSHAPRPRPTRERSAPASTAGSEASSGYHSLADSAFAAPVTSSLPPRPEGRPPSRTPCRYLRPPIGSLLPRYLSTCLWIRGSPRPSQAIHPGARSTCIHLTMRMPRRCAPPAPRWRLRGGSPERAPSRAPGRLPTACKDDRPPR